MEMSRSRFEWIDKSDDRLNRIMEPLLKCVNEMKRHFFEVGWREGR